MTFEISIVKYRGKFYVNHGACRLSKGYKTAELAQSAYDSNKGYYQFWAGSITSSVVNQVANGEIVTVIR